MRLRAAPRRCPALWRSLRCPPDELRLDLVLSSGQSFRWHESSPGCWTGVLAGRVWTLTQDGGRLWYTVYGEDEDGGEEDEDEEHEDEEHEDEEHEGGRPAVPRRSPEHPSAKEPLGAHPDTTQLPGAHTDTAEPLGAHTDAILRDYFQLDVGLRALYRAWGAADPHFQAVAAEFPGVRVLRQEPVECLLSFICTSNNHVARITAMIERLCGAFGRRLCRVGARPFHAFPTLQALAGPDVEARLRALGFGYRAKFVSRSARAIAEGLGAEGLRGLRAVPYAEARRVLCSLPGVGTKVADCVCLMALDKAEAVPVDTHVWHVARRHYGAATGAASLSARAHQEIGDFFRGLWGPYAGWAQAVLFCADLRKGRKPASSSGRPTAGRARGKVPS